MEIESNGYFYHIIKLSRSSTTLDANISNDEL